MSNVRGDYFQLKEAFVNAGSASVGGDASSSSVFPGVSLAVDAISELSPLIQRYVKHCNRDVDEKIKTSGIFLDNHGSFLGIRSLPKERERGSRIPKFTEWKVPNDGTILVVTTLEEYAISPLIMQ